MKTIVIAGGTGFLGTCLANYYADMDVRVYILTRGSARSKGNITYVTWDGKTAGPWIKTLEGADALINLNGKSVDCRYNEKNKAAIYSTRLDATRALGNAVENSKTPPKVWINSSSATIYRHSLDKEMDELTGEIGTGFSVDVCQKWESTFNSFETRHTRKVIIRTAIVLGKNGGALKPLKVLAKLGLGGHQGPGNQYFSWIHEDDFIRIIDFIITQPALSGVYNLASPHPISNHNIMKTLRSAIGVSIGIPMPSLLLKAGALLIGTEPELILKSRRVVPARLLEAGYDFKFKNIEHALADLIA
jgi:uncharacterized protein (TIGR01777 family)